MNCGKCVGYPGMADEDIQALATTAGMGFADPRNPVQHLQNSGSTARGFLASDSIV